MHTWFLLTSPQLSSLLNQSHSGGEAKQVEAQMEANQTALRPDRQQGEGWWGAEGGLG